MKTKTATLLSILMLPTITQGQVLQTDTASTSTTNCTTLIATWDDTHLLSSDALIYFEGYLEAIRVVTKSRMEGVAREFQSVCISNPEMNLALATREVIANLADD